MEIINLQQISPKTAELLSAIGRFAYSRGVETFLVGGPVRDLLMENEVRDIDIMVHGDAIAFSKQLFAQNIHPQEVHPLKPVSFKKYGTSKIQFSRELSPGIDSLDFASSRRETYPTPGGPPICKPGNIKQDLARRDFSINAMAASLSPGFEGQLLDYHNGQADIEAGLLRVLHKKSFSDDPARLIRAVRFLERFDFALSSDTLELYQDAISNNFVETLPKRRAFDELKKALLEARWQRILVALKDTGILSRIDPRLDVWLIEDLKSIETENLADLNQWEQRYLILIRKLPVADRKSLNELFNFSKSLTSKLESFLED
jgi:tRNA nucleotidyltransferase (CCA-adding enzyme)